MALWCFVLKEDLLLAWYYPRSTSGNWSWRLLLPTGFLGKVQSQCSPEFCSSSATMSHALEQINAARIVAICKECFKCFPLLAWKGSIQLAVQLVFPAYTLQLPSICVLLTAFKKLSLNKRCILSGTSWYFSIISSDMSALWRMKVPRLMSIRPMECWLETLNASSAIMSHALEQINAARIGVICQRASSKLSASCLHGYSDSIQKIQGFFWKAIFATPPIVLAVTIHTLPLKMRV